jgi:cytochrome P450
VRAAARRGDLPARLLVGASAGSEVWDLIEELRAASPAMHRGRFGFMTVDHAAAREVLSSADFRATTPAQANGPLSRLADRVAPDILHPLTPPSLLVTEPPVHTRLRRLVVRVFTARAVENLRARTEQIAHDLLDGLAAQAMAGTPVDLVEAYCSQLPVAVISEVLGVPASERDTVLALGAGATPSLDFGLVWRRYRSVDGALRAFESWLDTHIERLRREPGEDLLSQLIEATDQEGRLNPTELKSVAALVLAAGFETTVNLLGGGASLLTHHPAQLAVLRDEPWLWPNAVEEVLRLDPPVLLTARTSLTPTTIAGIDLPAEAQVATVFAGANRDPKVFTEPTTFDVARANARDHLSFSYGRHHCLGASLARMEGEVGLRALFDRYPNLEILAGARRRDTRILRGFTTLPVTLAGRARG